MNVLILGDGPEELAWADWLRDHPRHRLAAACPGFKTIPGLPGGNDLDSALAIAGIDAVICGGDAALRAEGLRRAASTGMRAVALHPPGPNADPYYQVALSRQENGAIVVPDLPARLHPGVAALEKAIRDASDVGGMAIRHSAIAGQAVCYEATVDASDGDLLGRVLPRVLDVVRALIGDVLAVTATGLPTNDHPSQGLTVQLRGDGDLHGEIRLSVGVAEPARLVVPTEYGSLTLEHDLDFLGPSRLIRKTARDGETITEIETWDPKAAILHALDDAHPDHEPSPGLTDGTRAMEVAEAAARGLRKGRTIDLHYEEMSEVGNFKSVMTSVGCALLLGTILIMLVAVSAHGMGFDQAVYIAWVVPPALVMFVLFQFLRYGIRQPQASERAK